MADRIRNASLLDIDQLCRLLSMAAHAIAKYFTRGLLLVLEREGTLQAACHVELVEDRPAIDMLVVADENVTQRMVGVANALCVAYALDARSRPAFREEM
jgi:hypothetical protein